MVHTKAASPVLPTADPAVENGTGNDERRTLPPVTHSGYRAVKRVFHTVVLVLTSALMFYAFLMYQKQQTNWLEFESRQPGQTLARQYSLILAPSLEQQDRQALNSLLAILTLEPSVQEATVYDSQGVLLAPLQHHTSVVSKTYLGNTPPVTHIADIKNQSDQVIGYLRILVDGGSVLDPPIHYEELRTRLTAIAALIAFVIGVYLTRGFYKVRSNLNLSGRLSKKHSDYTGRLNRRQ